MKISETIKLAQELIACPSITPNDAECQAILIARLKYLGFNVELFPFGDVKNFYARHKTESPSLTFIGHTDVVPTGPVEQWSFHPFQPQISNGYLYGRGAVDMKGSLSAMMVACERFISKFPDYKGSISWLITSDEEGKSVDGTSKVVEVLKKRNEKIDYCLVGEPTSENLLGDTLIVGRRGSLSGNLVIYGKQGHIAYPQLVENPIHKASTGLSELINTVWDSGYDFFEPTSFQISNIHAGTGASNVIPGQLKVDFNFRYSPAVTVDKLKQKVKDILDSHRLKYTLNWRHSGNPFLSDTKSTLVNSCLSAIKSVANITAELSTLGGTSDARFIADQLNMKQIAELGPHTETAHQIDECVQVKDLDALTDIYEKILINLFTIESES